MTEREVSEELEQLIEAAQIEHETKIMDYARFEDAEILSSNEGLVIKMTDGSEFQITIVQSR